MPVTSEQINALIDFIVQACYERHRAENCLWSNKSGNMCGRRSTYDTVIPCAAHCVDCPLHKDADND